jgi:hypothetical protein
MCRRRDSPRHSPVPPPPGGVDTVDSANAFGKLWQSSHWVRIILGVSMNKLAIVLAAIAALFLAAAPLTSAVAADKKLWEGFMDEMKKAREGAMAKPAAKK